MKKLLLDADYTVYKNCASNEIDLDYGNDVIVVQSIFNDAYKAVKRDIERITNQYMDPDVYLFFSDSKNFRKEILPSYKGHRNRKKPCGYRRVINKLKTEFNVITLPTLEADDAMGIFATMWEDTVICSPDKDMRQIPGNLYDMSDNTFITKSEGLRWHLIQSMAGDQTDGYGGCPGIGIKRAVTIFEKDGYTWEAVVNTFAEKDLGEDIALQNARLAKILTIDDYDFDNKQVRLWTPDANYAVNA